MDAMQSSLTRVVEHTGKVKLQSGIILTTTPDAAW
jgi:hypothetical protein